MPKQKSDVKKKGVSKVHQYSIDYLKYGFTEECVNESKPFCLLCSSSLCNDSMRPENWQRILNMYILKTQANH